MLPTLKVYTAVFTGHYPVGTAATIVAASTDKARKLLAIELLAHGLPEENAKTATITRLAITNPKCKILCDGDY